MWGHSHAHGHHSYMDSREADPWKSPEFPVLRSLGWEFKPLSRGQGNQNSCRDTAPSPGAEASLPASLLSRAPGVWSSTGRGSWSVLPHLSPWHHSGGMKGGRKPQTSALSNSHGNGDSIPFFSWEGRLRVIDETPQQWDPLLQHQSQFCCPFKLVWEVGIWDPHVSNRPSITFLTLCQEKTFQNSGGTTLAGQGQGQVFPNPVLHLNSAG